MFAAAAMSLSSVSVVANALRLKRLDLNLEKPAAEEPPQEAEPKEEKENIMKAEIKVDGMMCGHCVAHVEEALRGIAGVSAAKADLAKGVAFVEYEAPATLEQLESAITKAGYTVVK